jgi:membrane associated rhomboid family serine protease
LGDGQRVGDATEFYFDSALIDREAPVFLEFIETHRERTVVLQTQHLIDEYGIAALAPHILGALDFTHFLKDEVTAGNLEQDFWDENRQSFTELQYAISVFAYGFVPADFKVSGFIGAMFLHGGLDHLLGNMVFLFICGFALEAAFGRCWFLGLYLLSGCLSNLFWFAMNFDSYVYLVGASGAISGLMGMYAALYGQRQIRFFYWLLFFFGYFTAPALLIFPIWVGNELYGALFTGGNVAYYAHLGGLLSGFGLVFFCKDKILQVDKAYVEKEISQEDRFLERSQEMWDIASHFRFEKAWEIGQQLIEENQDDRQVLLRLYYIAKADPKSRRYHEMFHQIMTTESNDDLFTFFRLEILKDYLASTQDPQALTAQVCLDLVRPACLKGFDSESYTLSERLMHFIATKKASKSGVVCKALFRVFMQQVKTRRDKEANNLLKFLQEHYPDEEETGMAVESINLAAK